MRHFILVASALSFACTPGGGTSGPTNVSADGGPGVQGFGGGGGVSPGFGGAGGEGGQGFGGGGGDPGFGGAGGEAGGGGQGGQGGEGGFGGEGGEGGAVECAGALPVVTATLVEDRLYHRAEAVEVRYTVDQEAEVTLSAPEGGRFTPRDDHFFWAAGGGEMGDVDWPWWTGPVTLTVTANANGCIGEATVQAQLAGDVLVADWSGSYLFTLGSDGRRLGRFRQIGEQGLTAAIKIPSAHGGGFAVVMRPRNGEDAQVRKLTREGDMDVDFEMLGSDGLPLYPEGRRLDQIAFDPVNGYIVGDNGVGDTLVRWDLQGQFVDRIQLPGDNNFNDHTTGLAAFADGTMLAAKDSRTAVYAISPGGEVQIFTDPSCEVSAIGPGQDDTVILVCGNQNEVDYFRFDRNGRELAHNEAWQADARHIIPFMNGYLQSGSSSSRLKYRNAALEEVESEDSPFQQDHDFDDISTAAGVIWLHE